MSEDERVIGWDLLLLMIFSTISISSYILMPIGDLIRGMLVLPLIIFIPGYSLMSLLFPGAASIRPMLRTVFSFIMSFAISSIAAFALNEMYQLNQEMFGLRDLPVLLTIYTFSMVCATGAMVIRSRIPVDDRFRITMKKPTLKGKDPRTVIITSVLAIILISSVSFSVYNLMNAEESEQVELYLLGRTGEITGYPSLINIDQVRSVVVGINNPEDSAKVMKLIISTDPEDSLNLTPADPFVFGNGSYIQKLISLDPGDSMEFQLNFSFQESGRYTISFRLVENDRTIRNVWLKIRVFMPGMLWENDDGTIRIFLTDQMGNPLSSSMEMSSSASTRILLNLENDVLDILRMNASIYLDFRTSYTHLFLDTMENSTIHIVPGETFFNTTILGPYSKGFGLVEVSFDRGEYTLYITVNELALGCIFKIRLRVY